MIPKKDPTAGDDLKLPLFQKAYKLFNDSFAKTKKHTGLKIVE